MPSFGQQRLLTGHKMRMEPRALMDAQSEVGDFLATPAAYPGAPAVVERLETHGAMVFLAGPDAYKIKRAVRYSYMDVSTLERRRAAIEREFEVNRPHAPQIDQADLLSAVADRDALSPALARELADAVLESHRRAPRRFEAGADARIEKIARDLASSLATLDAHLPTFRSVAFATAAAAQIDRARDCLRRRGAAGLVARCHGDLHLGNIVLWNGAPTLFDAIEFDETLATIDTFYDLAFLLMDLDHRRHRATANIVLNRYLARSLLPLDIDGLAALPLCLGLRSAVRGLVTGQRALLQPSSSPQRATDLAAARSNLEDAMRYLAPPPPCLVAIGGFSGTGKSTLAAALAPVLDPAPGAVHIRSDVERKAFFGVAETDRLPPESYTNQSAVTIYGRILAKASGVLAAGHSAIIDAVFSSAEEREAVEAVAAAAGVPFTGIWLSAPRATMLARVDARRDDASDATAAIVDLQLKRGGVATHWHQVDAGGAVAATLAASLSLFQPRP
jgi:aminoglycoside phosphotransferase family enzyme/predicted kinase